MKITKYAHACLLIEVESVRIIVDPGSWNETPMAENVHAILITHEHQDHFNLEQIQEIISRNPDAVVITHADVARLIPDTITTLVIEEGKSADVNGVSIESFGHDHAIIYGDTVPCRNTGFLINNQLFVPGDALHDVPNRPVEILALPTGGPWMKVSEAIEYAKKVRPTSVFPIHDAMYVDMYVRDLVPRLIGGTLVEAGIEFRDMAPGATEEF